MSDPTNVYIASVSGGKCIENTRAPQGICRLRKWNKSAAQQWTMEIQNRKKNGGKIGVLSGQKQQWELVPAAGPQWWHIKSRVCEGAFLNDEWGRLNEDNKIQTYKFEEGNPGFNSFTISFVQAADERALLPSGSSTSASNDQAARKEDLDAREQELKKREDACAASEQGNSKGTEALKQKEAELAKKQEEVSRLQKERDTANARREQALEEKQAELDNKVEEAARLKKERDAVNAKSQQDSSQQAKDLEERQAAISRREEELAQRERDLATLSSQKTQDSPTEDGMSTQQEGSEATETPTIDEDVHQTCRLLRENDSLKYKLKVSEMESQLRNQKCQHKIKRPPRKIDRKVVGYVYT